ncbi:uncharacterized protein LOC113147435 [Cyclospora cayetanensis]|uniref:Uncharacterized protein LOC113147435 n=1 Tax=Cyclospora cayetanensis TaxID=88456 RepID=A0A6P6S200_9EIME|nr:uncharacterized protein LOC113147435 [Cyclospora cayetanensis]
MCAGCSSGELLLHSVAEGGVQPLASLGEHAGGILCVAYHVASGLFFSGAKDRMALGFDPRQPHRPAVALTHGDWITSLHAAASAPILPYIIRTGDKRVRTWDIRAPQCPLPEPQHRQHFHKQLISGVR